MMVLLTSLPAHPFYNLFLSVYLLVKCSWLCSCTCCRFCLGSSRALWGSKPSQQNSTDCWKGGRADKKSANPSIASDTGYIGEGVCFLVTVIENRFCVPRLCHGCYKPSPHIKGYYGIGFSTFWCIWMYLVSCVRLFLPFIGMSCNIFHFVNEHLAFYPTKLVYNTSNIKQQKLG